jgi:hypothetical protein
MLLLDLAAPLSDRPITEIVAAEILIVLKRMEKTGRRESARRLCGVIGSIFRHAIVTLRPRPAVLASTSWRGEPIRR